MVVDLQPLESTNVLVHGRQTAVYVTFLISGILLSIHVV
jgi:hypothetical protein